MRRIVLAICAIIVALLVVLGSVFGWTNTIKEKVSSLLEAKQEETEVTANAMQTQESTVTPEPTEAPVSFVAANGKAYYANPETAIDNTLQERLDAAIITEYNVYDVFSAESGDAIIKDADGREITARYDFHDMAAESIELLRDGYSVLAYSQSGFIVDNQPHTFAPAKDAAFAEKVFCKEHRSVMTKALTCVGYTGEVVGNWPIRGVFSLQKLDADMLDAFVLVGRSVEYDGRVMDAYTWALRTCTCGMNTISDGGNPVKPDVPTAEPTAAPTTAPTPTVVPTPTTAPTPTVTPKPTGDNNPRPTTAPTLKPTAEPTATPVGDNNPRPTVAPTQRPTTEPTATPVIDDGRPTVRPTTGPTQAPPPKVDDEF